MNKSHFYKWLNTLVNNPKMLLHYLFPKKSSYSQVWEDIILDFIFEWKNMGFYIDIWANHPKRLSNTLLFYKKWWSGINIEPNVNLYRWFLWSRKRDINLNIGIGPTNWEDLDFFVIHPDTLSTFDVESARQYEKEWHEIVEIKKVPIISLNDVYMNYVHDKQVDFMSIDTEWYDMEVLQSNDWQRNRPWFVIVETLEYKRNWFGKKLNDLYDPYFQDKNYHKYADTYINTIYISDEYAKKYKLAIMI